MNILYIIDSITQKQCEEFRTGIFVNVMIDGTKVNIEKSDSIQISRIGNNFIKFKIVFLNDCDYSLSIIETNFEHLADAIGDSIEIYAYEVEESIVRYKSISSDYGFVSYGELIKVK